MWWAGGQGTWAGTFFPHVYVQVLGPELIAQLDPAGTAFLHEQTLADVERVHATIQASGEGRGSFYRGFMSIFAIPRKGGPGIDDELFALMNLEKACNSIRFRIAGLAPDQFFRTATDDLPIADLIAQAVDRERAFLAAFQRGVNERNPRIEEPQFTLSLLDHEMAEDLAHFYDLRRMTLNLLTDLSEAQWQRTVTLPDDSTITLEDLALRLQWYDAHMLRSISDQRWKMIKESGVDELRDARMGGKLGANIAQ